MDWAKFAAELLYFYGMNCKYKKDCNSFIRKCKTCQENGYNKEKLKKAKPKKKPDHYKELKM